MEDTNEIRYTSQRSRNAQINWERTYRNMKQSNNKVKFYIAEWEDEMLCVNVIIGFQRWENVGQDFYQK